MGAFAVTPKEREELEQVLKEFLEREDVIEIDPKTHLLHHDWIRHQLEKEKIVMQRNEAITRHVVGWGIVGLITALGTIVWNWLKGNHAP